MFSRWIFSCSCHLTWIWNACIFFKILFIIMLTNFKKRYLFLTIKHDTYVMIWLSTWTMAKVSCIIVCMKGPKIVGLHVTFLIILDVPPSITIMVVVSVHDEIMSIFTRHCYMKTWDNYNHTKLLKVCTIQKKLQSPCDENPSNVAIIPRPLNK